MKKKSTVLFMSLIIALAFCLPAFAAETVSASGFYDVGTADSVTITPTAASGTATRYSADVNGDGEYETFYASSNKLGVTYSAAVPGARYGVLLVTGSGLPTQTNTIGYIDQVTATSSSISFDVYPKLPTESTDLTLYITSDAEGFSMIKVPLKYTTTGTFNVAPYTLGDVNGDGEVKPVDAQAVLQFAVGIKTDFTETDKAASDVNFDGAVDQKDAMKILQFCVDIITSWQ